MSDEQIHVHDLPQVYQKPAARDLMHALECLSARDPTFSIARPVTLPVKPHVDPAGVPGYLTTVVSSSLDWLEDDHTRETIWNLASRRLSERSGRNAMPSMTRTFQVTDKLQIELHEPSLTGDNLGLKTWTSSLILSQTLGILEEFIPERHRILELGAGTGLLGTSAACLWKADVLLTDLPEVVPNLNRNLLLNKEAIELCGGTVAARALDWADDCNGPENASDQFPVILAADPIYSPEHPKILVETVLRWLKADADSRVVVALPLRDGYSEERTSLRKHLQQAQLKLLADDKKTGYDDWYTEDGTPIEVECWWSIWQPSPS